MDNKRNWSMIGMIVSGGYGLAVAGFMGIFHGQFFPALWLLKPNEIGDLLSGVFAPLAFLWLFIATMMQGQELQENRAVMEQQATAAKEQALEAKRQAEIFAMQSQAMRDQVDLQRQVASTSHKVAMYEHRFKIYVTLQDFRKTPYVYAPESVREVIEALESIEFIFGQEFVIPSNLLLQSVKGLEKAFIEYSRGYGQNYYQEYARNIEKSTDGNQKDIEKLLLDEHPYQYYRMVKDAHDHARFESGLDDVLAAMKNYLLIDGEVGEKRAPFFRVEGLTAFP